MAPARGIRASLSTCSSLLGSPHSATKTFYSYQNDSSVGSNYTQEGSAKASGMLDFGPLNKILYSLTQKTANSAFI